MRDNYFGPMQKRKITKDKHLNMGYNRVPSYIYRRSALLLILYIESRGLLEFHSIDIYKRLYAVNIKKHCKMLYHLNYSVSPPWTTILFEEQNKEKQHKIYKLNLDSKILKTKQNNTIKRRGNDFWDKNCLNSSYSAITFLSDFELYFNGNYSQRFSIFGTQYISLKDILNNNEMEGNEEETNNGTIQWFVLVNECEGDICVGFQSMKQSKNESVGDFCDRSNGFGYHCDGFLKHNASFTRYGWKYGKHDTIGIILNLNHNTFKFSLNGKPCSKQNAIKIPQQTTNSDSTYRLAVSVGLNSVAQLSIIGFAK